ncbi:unnamed protein product [Calicophoron daubneyi]
MELDIEGLYNVHTLQESKNVEDQKRLIKLIKTLSSDEGWPLCTSLLLGNDTSLPDIGLLPEEQKSSIIFVCCRAVEEFLKSGIPVVAGEVEKIGSFLWRWLKVLSDSASTNRHQKYIKTKAGQLICLVVLRYFPKYWPSFFDELIFFLSEVSDKGGIGAPLPESVLVAIDLFLDTLINLDPYLVSRDVQLTTEETARGNEVKDGMRVSSVPSLLSSCYEMARVLYAPNLIYAAYLKKVLTAVGLMASWVDLCLVGSAEWINLSVNLLQASYEYVPSGAIVRAGVYAYFFGLVNKGMPNSEKLELINELWNRISNLLPREPSTAHSNGAADPGDEQSDASFAYALFINEVGQKLIEICK